MNTQMSRPHSNGNCSMNICIKLSSDFGIRQTPTSGRQAMEQFCYEAQKILRLQWNH